MVDLYMQTVDALKNFSKDRFKSYHEKVAKSSKPVLGVTVPKMREIAKRIIKNDFQEYLNFCEFKFFEDTMIYGFVIASLKFDDFLKYLPSFLSEVDSWAHIDSFVPTAKCIKKNKSEFFQIIKNNILSADGFTLRFYIVSLMCYYLDEEHLHYVFKTLEKIDGRGYYNDMAIAWLISVAYVKFKDKTFDFIKNCNLTDFTLNKSISKINDSFRVTRENKILLQNFIRKK